jgi:hypothetical protein
MGFTAFFCLSYEGINKERGSWFRLKEIEPRVKEFLASHTEAF